MKITLFYIALFVAFTSCSYESKTDLSKEREKILELHNAQRVYHFKKDSVAFANQFSEDFIGVGNGEISSQTRSERITRYHKYFSSVSFIKWDDVSKPIIKFSNDASMAYTIVDKLVVFSYTDKDGKQAQEKRHYAWTTIYRKNNNTWKIESVISTEKPLEN